MIIEQGTCDAAAPAPSCQIFMQADNIQPFSAAVLPVSRKSRGIPQGCTIL